jgi:NAD-dependent SIR2 family protein deacetylase
MISLKLKDIRNELNNNKLVTFVGAGASCNYGLPSWSSLIQTFATELNITEKDKFGNDIPKSSFTSDEYILIPLYYKIRFGEKKYKKTIKYELSQVNTSIKITEVYKPLFEIKPQHIITTNFDDLLEKENQKLIDKYDVIKCDKDLAKAKTNNYIVKMHGDLKKGNIVLNENDYLNYPNKFKLIDNFVKSLCATHTLLFIGFSFNDPNFKKLFHWVQTILGKDSKKAYFYVTDLNDIKSYQSEYFASKHINIITHIDLLGSKSNKLARGERTYKMINIIKNNFIEELYERLQSFRNFNIIFKKDIVEILTDFPYQIDLRFSNKFIIMDKEIVNKIESSFYSIAKYEFVENVLSKANFKGFYQKKEKSGHTILKKFNEINYIDHFFEKYSDFKYFEVLEDIDKINSDSVSDLRKKAFYLHKLGKNKKALIIYNKISKMLEKENFYSDFILNELSRKLIYQVLSYDCYKSNASWEDSKNIIIDNYINNLPLRDRSNAQRFHKIIKNIYYKYYSELLKIRNELEDDKTTIESGGWTLNEHPSSLLSIADELIFYIFLNYLPMDWYTDISSVFFYYFDSLMLSYTTKTNKNSITDFGEKSSKIYNLNYNPIFIAIHYLRTNDLIKVFKKYNPNFPFKLFKVKTPELVDNFSNLVNFIIKNRFEKIDSAKSIFQEQLRNRANNYILILSYCELSRKEFKSFIKEIINYNKKLSLFEIKTYLNPLLDNLKKNSTKLVDLELLIDNIFANFNYSHFKNNETEFRNFFIKVFSILPDYRVKKYKSMKTFLQMFSEDSESPKWSNSIYSLVEAYNIFGKGLKNELQNILSIECPILLNNEPKIYFIMSFYKIIKYRILKYSVIVNQLPLFFDYCKKFLQQEKKKKENCILLTLDYLYQIKDELKIKEKNILIKYFKDMDTLNPFYDFFLFEKQIKNKNFEATWLTHLLKAENPKKQILKVIKKLSLDVEFIKNSIHKLVISETNENYRKEDIHLLSIIDAIEKDESR